MSRIIMEVTNHIFDQEYLDTFIQLLSIPGLDIEHMIRIEICQAHFDLKSVSRMINDIHITSVNEIDHMEFIKIRKGEEQYLEFPYNKIIEHFPENIVTHIFILKIYFLTESIKDLLLFIGLDTNGIIRYAKELCWNRGFYRMYELEHMFLVFSAYLRTPPTPGMTLSSQAS